MPHIPRQFKPAPKIAPTDPSKATGVQSTKSPVPTKATNKSKRRVRAMGKINMADWDVNPYQIARDLAGGQ